MKSFLINWMLQGVFPYLSQHINYILGALGFFGVGLINSAPETPPSSLGDLYHWLRDAAQTALPINRRPKQ